VLPRGVPGLAAPPKHTIEQQREEPAPTAEEPSAASGGIMGVVVVNKSSTGNPATEAPAV
jgi:hypothetical protein